MATSKQAAKKPARTTRNRRVAAVEEGPRYQVLDDSYIDGVYRKAGSEVTYYGEPGRALKPLNAEALSRKQQLRDIRLNPDLDPEQKAAARKELSDLWNGVEADDDYGDSEADLDDNTDIRVPNPSNKAPLPDAERAELEGHAQAAIEAEKAKVNDDTNVVGVKLQGHNEPDPTEKQGATPVLDSQGKGPESKAADKK